MDRPLLMLRTRDPVVERRATRVAASCGLEPVAGADAASEVVPAGLLVELELDGAVEAVRRWRERVPELAIVAYLTTVSPELWREAELAGADEVTTRGRADRVLAACLEDRLSGRRRARRVRLAPIAEFAGRLGYVGRVDSSPLGPIALYHVSNRLWAIADACPHAGASLAEGELSDGIVTCPRHGSQFRVTDGARVRGPADRDLETFRVVVESGDAFVELPADGIGSS
jgi:nitrite reductase/ring-hydroxylating ferredoxin subunit